MRLVKDGWACVNDVRKRRTKKRYLPPMAKGEEVWCQLFSEPGAGSDLAGLKQNQF